MKKRESKKGDDQEKKQIRSRRRVSELYFKFKESKNWISKRLGVSKKFVIRWTRSKEQDFDQDNRGWKKGRGRRWSAESRKRIVEIHRFLKSSPEQFYCGATAIAQQWKERYPSDAFPPLRTIGQMLSDLGLSEKKRIRRAGAARYLCYPEHTIYEQLGYRLLEADFIGKKFLTGQNSPVNFIGFSFKKQPRLRYFKRVSSETAENFIQASQQFFRNFEIPDAVKVDNCTATSGSASGKRNLSRVMTFLLRNQVIPIFAVPRKPFSQASIEGNNSVFSRKFWNRERFSSVEEIERRLDLFNAASQKYTGYQRPSPENRKKIFIPKIFFIRQVRAIGESSKTGSITVLNEQISLPQEFINYFVLAEWNLSEEKLSILFEKEKKTEVIKKINFQICSSKNSGSIQRARQIPNVSLMRGPQK
jgi:transposase